ncbi:MAG: site-2 protease family protein [Brevundimonas sp.]|jgi:Zn-dependent protease|nr:site-2 protease family protein [Brevundimonas sp.]
MSDIKTSGPWGRRDGRGPPPAPAAAAPPPPSPSTGIAPPLVRGQNPVWALVSTLLLGGFIWWVTQSWVIAVAAVFGLFVHEYGHVLAMNRFGMGPARIYIIPFLGGVARSQRPPASEWDGVKVSLAGPAFGLLAAIPFLALYAATGQSLWLQGVAAIAFLNLVNLAPAPPLDGSKALGPVLARIHPSLEMGAMIAVGAAAIWWGFTNGAWIFAAFLALALFAHIRRGSWRPEGRRLTWGEAGKSVALFLLTAAACVGVGALGAGQALMGAVALPGVEVM